MSAQQLLASAIRVKFTLGSRSAIVRVDVVTKTLMRDTTALQVASRGPRVRQTT
jgi:hypothetical protein